MFRKVIFFNSAVTLNLDEKKCLFLNIVVFPKSFILWGWLYEQNTWKSTIDSNVKNGQNDDFDANSLCYHSISSSIFVCRHHTHSANNKADLTRNWKSDLIKTTHLLNSNQTYTCPKTCIQSIEFPN